MTDMVMLELVRTLRRHVTMAKIEVLILEHTLVSGRCPRCRTLGACTLYRAAIKARQEMKRSGPRT